MKNNDKKMRNVALLVSLMFLIIVALGVFEFCRGKYEASTDQNVYVFDDGWIYGREDQKKACAALAAAGLGDYKWDAGKLSVPASSKNAYLSALSSAGAYPKAPSESRGDALRQMSPFESDAKSKMRELDACALQLERTIEQMRVVDYATVGVRSRREVVGVTARNIVTASVGVAVKEGFELDSNVIIAITVTAQRLLGIEDSKNVAILDLKEGKSYLGFEKQEDQADDLALESLRERIEKSWRNKFLETFSDVENIRITVDVALVRSSNKTSTRNDVEQGAHSGIREAAFFSREDVKKQQTPTFCEDKLNEKSLKTCVDSAPISSCGFAQLGNPNAFHTKNARKEGGSIWAVDRTQRKRNDGSGVLRDLMDGGSPGSRASSSTSVRNEYGGGAGIALVSHETAPRLLKTTEERSDKFLVVAPLDSERVDSAYPETDRSLSLSENNYGIRQASSLEECVSEREDEDSVQDCRFELYSIVVHIWLPRTYVSRVISSRIERSLVKETFAGDSESNRETARKTLEKQILDETKSNAISIFRPTSKRLGWTEEMLEQSFIIGVYSDAGSLDDGFSNNPYEIKTSANFGSLSTVGNSHSHSETEIVQEYDSVDQGWSSAEDENSGIYSVPSGESGNDNRYGAIANTSGKVADISTVEEEQDSKGVQESEDDKVVNLNWTPKSFFDVNFWKQKRVYVKYAYWGVGILALLALGRIVFYRTRKENPVEVHLTPEESSKAEKKRKEKRRSETPSVAVAYNSYYSKLDNDEIDDELESELERLAQEAKKERKNGGASSGTIDNNTELNNFSDKRREALELISRYPERAAASLQGWVKGSNM